MKYTTESFQGTLERKFEENIQFQLMDGWVALVAAVGGRSPGREDFPRGGGKSPFAIRYHSVPKFG